MPDIAIETQGLGKRFGKHWAVNEFDLTVPKGCVFGLLGPNGAGKSTTINMLMGLLPPTAGRMTVLGMDPMKDEVAIRQRVGYVPEHYGYYEWMSVDQLIDLIAPYHTTWNETRRKELQLEFKLDGKAIVKNLSKGTRAKLALLLALSFEPEMLILDEPTSGLDPAARRNFIESILGHYQETGKTILVSSHLLNEFSGLIDQVAFIKEGRVHLACSTEELHQRMKRVRLVFEDGVPSSIKVPDTLVSRVNGREAVLTCTKFDTERTPQDVAQLGAANVAVEEMTLEDIFVDLVGS